MAAVAVFSGIIMPIYAVSEGNFLTYDNPSLGIKIQYPSDWKKSDANTVADMTIVAFTLHEKVTNKSITTVEVRIQSQPPQLTSIEDLRNHILKSYYKLVFSLS